MKIDSMYICVIGEKNCNQQLVTCACTVLKMIQPPLHIRCSGKIDKFELFEITKPNRNNENDINNTTNNTNATFNDLCCFTTSIFSTL